MRSSSLQIQTFFAILDKGKFWSLGLGREPVKGREGKGRVMGGWRAGDVRDRGEGHGGPALRNNVIRREDGP